MSDPLPTSRRRNPPASLDRLPPHSLEAEQGALGCCLTDPAACVPECVLALKDESAFYDLRHQTVFRALVDMANAGERLDLITVQQHLKDRQLLEQVGGIAYLSELQDKVPSSANLPYYTGIMQEKATLRRMVQLCASFAGRVFDYEGEVPELVSEFERAALALRGPARKAEGMQALLKEATDIIEWRSQNWDAIQGIPTGFPDLDRLTDGLHEDEMVVLAAFTSCGKTALGMNIACLAALSGIPVGVFSCEMQPVKLLLRGLMATARVNFRRMGEDDISKLVGAVGLYSKAPLHFESASGYSIDQLRSAARRMVQQHGVRLFMVDYIQLLTGVTDSNREREVASISQGLKKMATELNCPVVALSQLNEDGKLRESRAIAQDADSVWIVSNDGEWQADNQPAVLKVEKCRDGETGEVKLLFVKSHTRFESVAHQSQYADEN